MQQKLSLTHSADEGVRNSMALFHRLAHLFKLRAGKTQVFACHGPLNRPNRVGDLLLARMCRTAHAESKDSACEECAYGTLYQRHLNEIHTCTNVGV